MRLFNAALVALTLPASIAAADPTIPGATTTQYGTFPSNYRPYVVTFDPAGFLYAGSDNNDNAGQVIHRIPPGGGAAVPFSTAPIYDPDGIICDRAGLFSGTPGRILVAYTALFQAGGAIGSLDGSGNFASIIPLRADLNNNDAMAFDSSGRLYVNAFAAGTIVRFNGHNAEPFVTLPGTIGGMLAIDSADKVWSGGTDGHVRRYSSTGQLEATIPAGSVTMGMGFSPGGAFPAGIYIVNLNSGVLSRIGPGDTLVPVGTGFPPGAYHLQFDAAGNMFVPELDTGIVWKICTVGCRCGLADVASLGGAPHPDGELTPDDIITFLAAFFAAQPLADIAGLGGSPGADGLLTVDDIVVFLAAFFAGCS